MVRGERERKRDRVKVQKRKRVREIKYVNCKNRETRRTQSFDLAAAIAKLVWSSNLNLRDKARFENETSYFLRSSCDTFSRPSLAASSLFEYLWKIKERKNLLCFYITNLDSKLIPAVHFTRLRLWLRVSNLLCLSSSIELIVDFPRRNRPHAKVLDDTFCDLGATRPLLNFI